MHPVYSGDVGFMEPTPKHDRSWPWEVGRDWTLGVLLAAPLIACRRRLGKLLPGPAHSHDNSVHDMRLLQLHMVFSAYRCRFRVLGGDLESVASLQEPLVIYGSVTRNGITQFLDAAAAVPTTGSQSLSQVILI